MTRSSFLVLVFLVTTPTVLLFVFPLSSTPTLADLAYEAAMTPTVFNYLPFVAKNWAHRPIATGTPTPTPTSTATPTETSTNTPTTTPTNTPPWPYTPTATPTGMPIPTRILLCCYDNQLVLDDGCIISGWACFGEAWLYYPGARAVWDSMTLLKDITATIYTLGIAVSSSSSTEFKAEIVLVQGEEDVVLASTSFTANSSTPIQFASTVEGIDPTVNRGEDKLEVRISHVSGGVGQIYFGVPQYAGAGGSYVELQFEDLGSPAYHSTIGAGK